MPATTPSSLHRRPGQGFSLLELLTVMVVLGVLVQLMVPSMTKFLDETARTQAISEFMSGLATARAQAITSGQRVFVCPRDSTADNAVACATPKTAKTVDWSLGFYVFNGTAADGVTPLLTDGSILWEYDNNNANISITQFSDDPSDTTVLTSPIAFSAVGRIDGPFALWRFCRKRGSQVKQGSIVAVQLNGGASLEAPENNEFCG